MIDYRLVQFVDCLDGICVIEGTRGSNRVEKSVFFLSESDMITPVDSSDVVFDHFFTTRRLLNKMNDEDFKNVAQVE